MPRSHWRLWIGLVLGPLTAWAAAGPAPPLPNCGVAAIGSLAHWLGREPSAAQQAELQAAYPNEVVTLHDVQSMGATLGLALVGVKASLEELLAAGAPALLALKSPDHFTVLLDGDAREVRLQDGLGAPLQYLARADLARRYTGLALVAPTAVNAPGPRAAFEATWSKHGRVQPGTTLRWTCRLTNRGQAPLTISIAGSSCTCTAAVVGTERLAPGQTSSIELSWLVQGAGPTQQVVTVTTNDPRRPRVPLSLEAEVEGPLARLMPEVIHLLADAGAPAEATLRVVGQRGLLLDHVDCNLPGVQASIAARRATEQGVTWEVTVVSDGRAPVGRQRGALRLLLLAGEAATLEVPVLVEVRPEVLVAPASVFVAEAAMGAPTVVSLVLTARAGKPFRVTQVSSTSADVVVRGAGAAAAAEQRLQVEICPSRLGLLSAELRLTTDLPAQPELLIPVVAMALAR